MANAELTIILKSIDQATPGIKKTNDAIMTLAKSAAAIFILKQGFDFLKNSIDAAGEKESALRLLQTAIENSGQSWETHKQNLINFTEQLEDTTMYTDEEAITALKNLANFGMSVAESQDAIRKAMDLATAKGIDLETSVNLIGKAYQGNIETLKRYGIEAKDFNDLMGQVNSKFGEAAQKQMDTYAGKVNTLKDNWQDFKENIGKAVIPTVNLLIDTLNHLFRGPDPVSLETKLNSVNETIKQLKLSLDNSTYEPGRKVMEARLKEYQDLADKLKKEITTTTKPPVTYTPKKTDKQIRDEEEALKAQQKKNEEMIDMTLRTYDEINKITMDSYQYDEYLIQQGVANRKQAGVDKVTIAEWVAAKEKELEEKKFNAVLAMANYTGDAFNKIGAATIGGTIKGITTLIQAVQVMVTSINIMMMASGPLGFIMGLLGVVGGAVNIIGTLDELSKLGEEAKELAELPVYKLPEPGLTTPTTTTGRISTIAREAQPINNIYNLNYYLQPGVMLGDENNINNAFKILMNKYNEQKALVMA